MSLEAGTCANSPRLGEEGASASDTARGAQTCGPHLLDRAVVADSVGADPDRDRPAERVALDFATLDLMGPPDAQSSS